MSNVLIIGYGNPLCSDDGVAWAVVETVQDCLIQGSAVAVHQLTPEWAEAISQAGRVIFVDAAIGDVPGEVSSFPLARAQTHRGSHDLTPDGLLGMAHDLYGRCPPAFMLTITGGSFEIAEQLSPPVSAAVPEAVRRILALIE